MSLKHGFESEIADAGDSDVLKPSNWGSTSTDYETDPTHVFDGGALGSLLYRDTGAADGSNWLAAAAGVLICSGAGAVPSWSSVVGISASAVTSSAPIQVTPPLNGIGFQYLRNSAGSPSLFEVDEESGIVPWVALGTGLSTKSVLQLCDEQHGVSAERGYAFVVDDGKMSFRRISIARTDLQTILTADSLGNVGIGVTSPNAVALLDVSSTTKGFLPPRMTEAQRDAIATPPAGLVIYNTTTAKLNLFTTVWEALTSA